MYAPVGMTVSSRRPPLLDARQQALLQRVWDLQNAHIADHVVLFMTGRVRIDGSPADSTESLDLKVEILGGESAPDGAKSDAAFEALVDSMPRVYLRRLDREDPGEHLQLGQTAVVTLSDDGIRYLRES